MFIQTSSKEAGAQPSVFYMHLRVSLVIIKIFWNLNTPFLVVGILGPLSTLILFGLFFHMHVYKHNTKISLACIIWNQAFILTCTKQLYVLCNSAVSFLSVCTCTCIFCICLKQYIWYLFSTWNNFEISTIASLYFLLTAAVD